MATVRSFFVSHDARLHLACFLARVAGLAVQLRNASRIHHKQRWQQARVVTMVMVVVVVVMMIVRLCKGPPGQFNRCNRDVHRSSPYHR